MTKDGVIIDTMSFLPTAVSRISNKAASAVLVDDKIHLLLTDLNDNSVKTVSNNAPFGYYYIFDNTDTYIYCFGDKGVYKINVSTGESSFILSSCFRKEYARPTLTLNQNFIVASRYENTLLEDKITIYYEINLYKIPLDGSEPVPLNVP